MSSSMIAIPSTERFLSWRMRSTGYYHHYDMFRPFIGELHLPLLARLDAQSQIRYALYAAMFQSYRMYVFSLIYESYISKKIAKKSICLR